MMHATAMLIRPSDISHCILRQVDILMTTAINEP